jgi:6,7-dimethyl-8-ribityllumazine synthase
MSENTFTHNTVNVNPLHKITIVAARWNAELVDDLVHAASEHLTKIGYKNIETIYVPGSWELVHASQKALEKSDGVISFGVVIRGETTHYELISESVAQGLMQVSIDAKKPLALGLIATENFDQAKKRCDPSELNKGKEIAQSLAETL